MWTEPLKFSNRDDSLWLHPQYVTAKAYLWAVMEVGGVFYGYGTLYAVNLERDMRGRSWLRTYLGILKAKDLHDQYDKVITLECGRYQNRIETQLRTLLALVSNIASRKDWQSALSFFRHLKEAQNRMYGDIVFVRNKRNFDKQNTHEIVLPQKIRMNIAELPEHPDRKDPFSQLRRMGIFPTPISYDYYRKNNIDVVFRK